MAIKIYHHLKYEDRCQIHALRKNGNSNSSIAKQLSVHRSTIGRELKRNKGKCGYRYKQAETMASFRRKIASKAKKKMVGELFDIVLEKLTRYQWSPEQIAGWLKKNKQMSISHETIYKYIWRNKKSGGDLCKHLRHNGKKYNKRSGKTAGRGLIPNRIDIDQRPTIVEEKSRVGDWELDTIIGKNHAGALISMVDRASKYTKIVLIQKKTAIAVKNALKRTLSPLNGMVHTLTSDNGKEFALHEKVASYLDAQFYFAKPYHSWERGLNEHTNGLIRQYFPKKTRFDTISKCDVQKVENLLNLRPRKILHFQTPFEVFNKAFFKCSIVALQN